MSNYHTTIILILSVVTGNEWAGVWRLGLLEIYTVVELYSSGSIEVGLNMILFAAVLCRGLLLQYMYCVPGAMFLDTNISWNNLRTPLALVFCWVPYSVQSTRESFRSLVEDALHLLDAVADLFLPSKPSQL